MYIPKHAKLSPKETLFVIMDQPLIQWISTRIAKKIDQIQALLAKLLDKWDIFLEKISRELEKEKLRWLIRIKTLQRDLRNSSLNKNILRKIISSQH